MAVECGNRAAAGPYRQHSGATQPPTQQYRLSKFRTAGRLLLQAASGEGAFAGGFGHARGEPYRRIDDNPPSLGSSIAAESETRRRIDFHEGIGIPPRTKESRVEK